MGELKKLDFFLKIGIMFISGIKNFVYLELRFLTRDKQRPPFR